MNKRYLETENNIEGTCTWLHTHATYQSWLCNERGLLWIKGKPGTGKSTLMKYALQDAKRPNAVAATVLHFFFHGRGASLQKSPVGLFRALAHQVGLVQGRYIHSLVKESRARTLSFQSWSWTALELEEHLGNWVLPAILMDKPVRIFIDALDECGDVEARRLVQSLARIHQLCTRTRFGLSICFSCRYYPIIAPDICEDIRLEDENEGDISLYIRQELRPRIADLSELASLEKAIEGRSQHVFQWVVLVVSNLVWLHAEGNTLRQLLDYIKQIPAELHSLYADILQTLVSKQPARSLKLFQWVCTAERTLSISEMRCAMSVDATLSMSGKTLQEWAALDDYIETDAQMKRLLVSLSGGLVELTSFGVQLIHQSVLDFLLEKGFAALASYNPITGDSITSPTNQITLPTDQDTFLATGHHRLARSCLVYYLAIRREHLTRFHLFRAEDIVDLARQHPLLEYAVQNWLVHASRAETKNVSQADLCDFLPGRSNHCLEHWQSMAHVFLRWADVPPHPGTTLLHEAVRVGLYSLIPSLTTYMSINAADAAGKTPLCIAARYCGIEAVRYLLTQPLDVDINRRDAQGRTALTYAIEVNALPVVIELLNDSRLDVSVNLEQEYTMGLYHGSAIFHAARLCFTDTLHCCLGHSGLRRIDGNAVLKGLIQTLWARGRGSGDIFATARTLLESQNPVVALDLTAPMSFSLDGDVEKLSPLLWLEGLFATHPEFEDIVAQHVDINALDGLGQGPLHRAILRLTGVGIGRTSVELEWELERVTSLLQRGWQTLDINHVDNTGNTPLAYAITGDYFEHATRMEVVQALLAHPGLDINKKVGDGDGTHPLCLADREGWTEIVDLLLADPRLDLTDINVSELPMVAAARRAGKCKEVTTEIRIEITGAETD